jgi:hypothetical protein
MKRVLLTSVLGGLLLIPASAVAKPAKVDRVNASQECRTERGGTAATREAFRVRYGTNKTGRNAYGKCVSRMARAEAAERRVARTNAAKACKAERSELGAQAFADKYGTNKSKRNAYGKCVSTTAKALNEEEDAEDLEAANARKAAAKDCASERSDIGRAAFADKYGTNKSKRNAFGKCVSATVRADDEPEPEPAA